MKDTIVALATPPGVSGLAVIRVSGDNAISIADKCFVGKNPLTKVNSHTIHYGKILHDEIIIDNVTVAVFKEPNSYTGENSVEISCHGGMIVYDEIINILIKNGCRLAEPGEFTKRAFINGKMDLTQVEAVADIIHSVSVPGAITSARQLNGEFTLKLKELRQKLLDVCSLLELELDFSDEDIELIPKEKIKQDLLNIIDYCNNLSGSYKFAEILRSGFFVGIAGFPNSGKSTLFNSLLERKRAIVSEIPGTTRDYLEEMIYLNGIAVKIIDTAGLRDTKDIIEIEGIKLVESVLEQSNMILVLNDISVSKDNSDGLYEKLKSSYPDSLVILVQNKIDKIEGKTYTNNSNNFFISAKNGGGLNNLKDFIEKEAKESTNRINDVLINQRHSALLNAAAETLMDAVKSIDEGRDNELISIEIRNAVKTLGEITGESWNEDLLNNIFSRFCIGK